MSDVKTLSRDT